MASAFRGFETVHDIKEMIEVCYLQSRYYHQIEKFEERNSAAKLFKQLTELHNLRIGAKCSDDILYFHRDAKSETFCRPLYQ